MLKYTSQIIIIIFVIANVIAISSKKSKRMKMKSKIINYHCLLDSGVSKIVIVIFWTKSVKGTVFSCSIENKLFLRLNWRNIYFKTFFWALEFGLPHRYNVMKNSVGHVTVRIDQMCKSSNKTFSNWGKKLLFLHFLDLRMLLRTFLLSLFILASSLFPSNTLMVSQSV